MASAAASPCLARTHLKTFPNKSSSQLPYCSLQLAQSQATWYHKHPETFYPPTQLQRQKFLDHCSKVQYSHRQSINFSHAQHILPTLSLKDNSRPVHSASSRTIVSNKRTREKGGDKLAERAAPHLSAAYLGPQIWNKTMLSDDLKLETADLDELLNENAMQEIADQVTDPALFMCANPSSVQQLAPTLPNGTPNEGTQYFPNDAYLANDQLQSPMTKQPNTQDMGSVNSRALQCPDIQCMLAQPAMLPQADASDPPVSGVATEEIECFSPGMIRSSKTCDYRPDITDAILSTFMSNESGTTDLFDPRKRSFTDDELKPQPIIRKAKKTYVSEECKDGKYWRKREKNNVAAKRSREARRIKENQIAMRANFLEKENDNLKKEVKDLRTELKRLVDVVSKYEKGKQN